MTYDLRPTTYDVRPTTYNVPTTTPFPPNASPTIRACSALCAERYPSAGEARSGRPTYRRVTPVGRMVRITLKS